MSPDNIAEFQSLLLEILDSQQDAGAIRDCLNADISLSQIGDCDRQRELVKYIETSDPVMLEIAAILVKKWGRKPFR
jgi:aminoglycoside phosphotransferase family enzyme